MDKKDAFKVMKYCCHVICFFSTATYRAHSNLIEGLISNPKHYHTDTYYSADCPALTG